MTSLWLMSDLHIENAPLELPKVPADVLVIAGDIGDGHDKAVRWLQHALPSGLSVIFTGGNHECYGHDLLDDQAEAYEKIGVHLLHRGRPSVVVAGVRFVGLTLWTDYRVAGDEATAIWWAKQHMPDFLNIDVGMRRLRPADLLSAHQIERDVLEIALSEPFDGPTVVVTHHAPHPQSLAPALHPESSASWGSDLTEMIERYRPTVWNHGHVHESFDYTVADTRVICNPRGYAAPRTDGRRPGNPDFLVDLVIEV